MDNLEQDEQHEDDINLTHDGQPTLNDKLKEDVLFNNQRRYKHQTNSLSHSQRAYRKNFGHQLCISAYKTPPTGFSRNATGVCTNNKQ